MYDEGLEETKFTSLSDSPIRPRLKRLITGGARLLEPSSNPWSACFNPFEASN